MIAQPVSKLLVAQVAHELAAHQTYAGMALYFDRQSLKGWAKSFHDQSTEEAGHAAKIMAFLIDNEVAFTLPAIPSAPTSYEFGSGRRDPSAGERGQGHGAVRRPGKRGTGCERPSQPAVPAVVDR